MYVEIEKDKVILFVHKFLLLLPLLRIFKVVRVSFLEGRDTIHILFSNTLKKINNTRLNLLFFMLRQEDKLWEARE